MTAANTRYLGMNSGTPATSMARSPPTNQRTPMNVIAVTVEDRMPTAKSTGGSVATRASCEMRASGFWWSPRTRLS